MCVRVRACVRTCVCDSGAAFQTFCATTQQTSLFWAAVGCTYWPNDKFANQIVYIGPTKWIKIP